MILDTQVSISQEIEKKKKEFYIGDSQSKSMLKKEEILSKIEISHGPGDPFYSKEFAPKARDEPSMLLYKHSVAGISIREEI